ncbi:hypothetical protein [Ammoniphilus resinae]|uniref:Uncharacterized protein n=1 Tax=Ammoniphilus resinae TaxID=861532 RepID=A0ABS4GU70_9BACL|nr:hypothetical protein [Ammoniphilus resinae]MBP1933430.1 hypothetical protein [Ammoniphilus resinae]
MQRSLIYLVMSIGVITALVVIKLWVIPFSLWHLFPQNDLVSRLYEVFIMAIGGMTFLSFIVLGYIGKNTFHFGFLHHLMLHFLLQLPFAFFAFLEELSLTTSHLNGLMIFSNSWSGLIAEPTRLIFMVYPWTDIFALVASFVFLSIGRSIEIVDEDQVTNQRMRLKQQHKWAGKKETYSR